MTGDALETSPMTLDMCRVATGGDSSSYHATFMCPLRGLPWNAERRASAASLTRAAVQRRGETVYPERVCNPLRTAIGDTPDGTGLCRNSWLG